MPSVRPTIEEMLAAVENNRVKCPVCGLSDTIDLVYCSWYYKDVTCPLDGSLNVSPDDSDSCNVPSEFDAPDLLCCDNVRDHPNKELHWWPVPKDTAVHW